MKKTLLLFATGLLFITSCKNDDDENQIVGTWYINKYVTQFGDGTSETETPDTCEKQSNLIFAADNNVQSNEYYTSGSSSCELDRTSGTYSYDESTRLLSWVIDGENLSVNVTTLNSSELVFVSDEGDYDGDGKNDKYLVYLKK